jgi:superfamily II DNA or RNA helicase
VTDVIQLRPPQLASIDGVQLAIAAGEKEGLVVLPTGTGKTIMSMALSRRLGLPTLFLCHRDRLIQQTVKAASVAWPEAEVGVIQGERDEWGRGLFGVPSLVVASVQSLYEKRLLRIPRDRFGFVIADECHRAATVGWTRILEWFQPAFRLGMTATPQRLDGKGLAPLFGREPVYAYSLFQAIADEMLVQVDSREIDTRIDLSKLAVVNDFVLSKLADAVNTPERNGMIVDAYVEHGQGRRAIAFCVDVEHAIKLADAFNALGIAAASVSSKQSGEINDQVLDDFAAGKYQVVTNCEVLTEGFDDPGVSCLLMARPTMSRALYIQMVGRGLRLHPDKVDCRVIDFTDNCKKHKLACSTDLFGRHKAGKATATSLAAGTPAAPASQGPLSTPILSWKIKGSNPWPELPDLENYESIFPWDDDPATSAQIKAVKAFGLEVGRSLTKGEASYLIDRCKEFESTFPTPASVRQRYYLEQCGLWTDGMSKRQASAMIVRHQKTQRAYA